MKSRLALLASVRVCRRVKQIAAFLILFLGFQCVQASGQVVATWTDNSGSWSNAANWSTFTVPNNGGGTTYSVTVNAAGSTVSMDVLNDTIDNLYLGPATSLNINTGKSLTLVSGVSILDNSGPLSNSNSFSVLNNYGALVNSGGIRNSGIINNNGLIINLTSLVNDFGQVINNDTLVNKGTLADIGSGSWTNNGILSNRSTGSIDLGESSTFMNSGTVINSGAIIGGGIFTDNVSAIGNTGLFINRRNGSISDLASLTNQGTLINNGSIQNACSVNGVCAYLNSGTIINNGSFANVISPSLIMLETGHSCDINGGCTFANSGNLINRGFFNNTGALSNSGVLFNRGTLLDSGTLTNSGILLNSGAMTISSTGTLATSTNYTQTSGSTLVDGTLTATGGAIVDIKHGILSGTGTINGNVLMGGTLRPGDAPGTLTIFGNYEQTHTGTFDELLSPSSHSLLDVSGKALLDHGTGLEIALLNGFNPIDQTFDSMNYSSLTGVFADGSSFWDDGFLWDVTYGANQIDITAVQAGVGPPTSQTPEPGPLLLLALGSLTFGAFAMCKKLAQ